MTPAATLPLASCVFEVWSATHCRTVFPDGAAVPASPEGTPEQAATARELGYGEDVAGMVRDHELAHTLIAEWCGLPGSPTLRRVATGAPREDADGEWWEEALVLAFQRFVRTGAVGGPLRFFTRDLASWRDRFLAVRVAP